MHYIKPIYFESTLLGWKSLLQENPLLSSTLATTSSPNSHFKITSDIVINIICVYILHVSIYARKAFVNLRILSIAPS